MVAAEHPGFASEVAPASAFCGIILIGLHNDFAAMTKPTIPPERERLLLLGLALGMSVIGGSASARACVRVAGQPMSAAGLSVQHKLELLFGELDAGRLTATQFLREVTCRLGDLDLAAALSDKADLAATGKHVFLAGREKHLPARLIKLYALGPGGYRAPHAHHDQASVQVVVRGQVSLLELDKVGRTGDATLLLRRAARRTVAPGGVIASAERYRNIHWFAAGAETTVLFSVKAMGRVGWTLDQPDTRPPGPFFLDLADRSRADGLVVARHISDTAAANRYRNRHPHRFPWPA